MANITWKVGLELDSNKLESQLNTIRKEINDVVKGTGKQFTGNLGNAVNQAHILGEALQNSMTSAGTSAVSFNKTLIKSGTTATQLVATLAAGGESFNDSLNIALTTLATSNRYSVALSRNLKEAARVFTQSFKFSAAQAVIRSLSSAMSSAVTWTKDLNEQLTQIGIVSNKTGKELDKVYKIIIDGSRELKVAARDYAEAAQIFYQQGLNDTEVQKRSEIVVKAAKAAGQSVETMSSQLTAIWNTYQMSTDQLEVAASKAAKLGAETAIEFKDIAEAMQSSASAAAQMGVEYDSLAAMIATVGSATQQSASIVGNAFKTIFSRFEQLKADGTDGEITLNRISAQLANLGINVLDASGELRKLDDVITEVGNNWDNWSNKQQLAIAELVGGTRQYGQFLALMNNFETYQKNLASAQMDQGDALAAQYTIYQEGVEAAQKRMTEAWKQAFGDLFNDDLLKGFYNALTGVGKVVDSLLDGFGGLPGILGTVATLLSGKIATSVMLVAKDIQSIGLSAGLKIGSQLQKTGVSGLSNLGSAMINRSDQKVAKQMANENAGITSAFNYVTERQNAKTYENQPGNLAMQNILSMQKFDSARLQNYKDIQKEAQQLNKILVIGTKEEKLNAQYSLERLKIKQKTRDEALAEAKATQLQVNKLRTSNNFSDGSRAAQLGTAILQPNGTEAEKLANIKDKVNNLSDDQKALFGAEDILAAETYEEILTRISEKTQELLDKAKNKDEVSPFEDTDVTREQAEALNQAAEKAYQMADAEEEAASQIDAATIALLAQEQQAKNTAVGLQTAVSMLGALTMVVSSVSNILKKVSDENASAGDIIMTVVAAAAALIPVVISLASAIAAMEVAAWPITIIIVTIVAAIALLAVGINAIIKAQPAAKLKEATKHAEQCAEALNEAASAAESLRAAFDNYDTVNQALKDATVGTEEWKQALADVNQSVNDLIQTYPELLSMTKDGQSAITTGDNGELQIADWVRENLTKAANAKVAAASAVSMQAQRDKNTAAAAVASQPLSRYGITNTSAWANATSIEELRKLGKNTGYAFSDSELEDLRTAALELKTTLDNNTKSIEVQNKTMAATTLSSNANVNRSTFAKDIIATQGAVYGQAYDKAYNSTVNKQTSQSDFEKYAKMMGLDVASIKKRKNNGDVVYKDSSGEKITVSSEDISAALAGAMADESVNKAAEALAESFATKTSEEVAKATLASSKDASKLSVAGLNKADTAESLGLSETDVKNMGFESLNAYNTALQEAVANAKDAWQKTVEDHSEAATKILELASQSDSIYSELTTEALDAYGNVIDTIVGKGGTDAAQKFTNSFSTLLTQNSDKAEEIMRAASGIDWSQGNAALEELQGQLHDMGVTIDENNEMWQNFKVSVANIHVSIVDSNLEEIRKELTEISDICKDIKIGSVISDEDYETLTKYNGALKEMFAITADGYVYTGNEDLQKLAQEAAIKELQNTKANNAKMRNTATTLNNSTVANVSFGNLSNSTPVNGADYSSYVGQALSAGVNADDLGFDTAQLQAAAHVVETATDTTTEDYKRALTMVQEFYGELAELRTNAENNVYDDTQAEQIYASILDSYEKLQEAKKKSYISDQVASQYATILAANTMAAATSLSELATAEKQAADAGATVSWENHTSAMKNLAEQYTNCSDELSKYQVAIDNWENAQTAETEAALAEAEAQLQVAIQLGETAEKYGLDAEAIEIQAEALMSAYEAEKMTEAEATRLALANQRMNKGVTALNSNFEDWNKLLKSTDKTSSTYAETMSELRTCLADVLNESDENNISLEFMEENMVDIEKAASGDADAINRLGLELGIAKVQALDFADVLQGATDADGNTIFGDITAFENAKNTIISGLQEVQGQLSNLSPGDDVNFSADFVQSLNDMAAATGMSVQEMNDYLSQIGVTTTVSTKEITQTSKVPKYTTVSKVNYYSPQYTDDQGEHPATWSKDTYTYQSGVQEVDETLTVASLGTEENPPKFKYVGSGSSRKAGVSGQKTNGEGSKASTPKQVRYKTSANKKDAQTSELNKISKASENAFGSSKLALMNKYQKQLSKIANTYKEIYEEAKAYADADEASLKGNNVLGGLVQFGEIDGKRTILNLDEVYQKIENLAANSDDAVKESAENARTLVENYLEAVDKMADALEQQVEQIREFLQSKLEEVDYKIELRLSINETDLKIAELALKELGDAGIKTGQNFEYLQQSLNNTQTSVKDTTAAIDRILEIQKNMSVSAEDENWFTKTFGKEAWDQYQSTGELTGAILENLSSKLEDLLDYKSTLIDQYTALWAEYRNVLSAYMDDFDTLIGKYDRSMSVLEAWQNVMTNTNIKASSSTIKALNDAKLDTSAKTVSAKNSKYSVAKAAFDEASKQYQDALKKYQNDTSSAAQLALQELKKNADEAEKYLQEADADRLNALADYYEKVKTAAQDYYNAVKAEQMGELEYQSQLFANKTEEAERYLDETNKDYGLDTLGRQIEQSMDAVTNPQYLKKYQDFLDQVNAKKAEGVQMTQDELDIMNAQFELMKAEDAYEEAKNNKNTMRLTRDASGNYSYVYSSDAKQTDDAAQKVADSQNKLYNLQKELMKKSEEGWMATRDAMVEYLDQIDQARYQSDAAYKKEVDEQIQFYQNKLNFYAQQVNTACDMLDISFGDTTLGVVTGCSTMDEANEQFQKKVDEVRTKVNGYTKQIADDYTTTAETVVGDYDDVNNAATAAASGITDSNSTIATSVTNLAATAKKKLSEMNTDITNSSATWITNMKATMATIDAYIAKIQAMRQAEANKTDEDDSQTTKPETTPETPAETDTGSADKTVTYNKGDKLKVANSSVKFASGATPIKAIRDGEGLYVLEDKGDVVRVCREAAWGTPQQGVTGTFKKSDLVAFASGGYTGTFSGGQLGILHEKELVLNKDDTANILAAVNGMRSIVGQQLTGKGASLNSVASIGNSTTQLDQNVHIDATFPNVSSSSEIEDAFNNLINRAAQYSSRK